MPITLARKRLSPMPELIASEPFARSKQPPQMRLEPSFCAVCGIDDCIPIAVGSDFEYHTTNEEFLAVQCRRCKLVYLNPRPDRSSMARAYPDNYHAFDFDSESFGTVYRIRQRLEARRLLAWCRGLGPDAKILDVGCGDGFHLQLLKRYGNAGWSLEGVDADPRAALSAARRGVTVHGGRLEDLPLEESSYDLILMIMTIEHVADPRALVERACRLLHEGGKLIIVTDNTGSPDFSLFRNRHWGGYHFPRHLYLFNRTNLAALCENAGLTVHSLKTAVSPVNWTYSMRNWIQDWHGPDWLRNRFSLRAPLALAAFTLLDIPLAAMGYGAVLHGVFVKK